MNKPLYIVVDFDGTCVKHEFPEIGEEIGSVRVLKKLSDAGHRIILYTMRSDGQKHGNVLAQAVMWFFRNGIMLYGIQENPDQESWTSSPKPYGHVYIDDAALGCPLIIPEDGGRPYVDWDEVERILIQRGIL